MAPKESLCQKCGEISALKCVNCAQVFYCSKEHQKEDWITHKPNCFPFKVESNDELGRYLVATRDIKQGEVLIAETALLLGPKRLTQPVCLGCHRSLEGWKPSECHPCSKCGWALCSATCEDSKTHVPECSLTRENRPQKVAVKEFDKINHMYECVTVLRGLYTKLHAPEIWNVLSQFESHVQKRKEKAGYQADKINVVGFIRQFLKIEEFEEDEIHRMIGILEVNGVEVPWSNLCAIYQWICLTEHNCIGNTERLFGSDGKLSLRCVIPIPAGRHISTCYPDPMWGTRNRQLYLNETKYFTCSCPRCMDPTEMGSNLSTLRCQFCRNDWMLPVDDPRMDTSPWMCSGADCGKKMSAEKINIMIHCVGQELILLEKGGAPACEFFLKKIASVLHPNHYYSLEVYRMMSQIIGSRVEAGETLDSLSLSEIQQKRDLDLRVLSIADLIVPGWTRLRGFMLYEYFHSTSALAEKRFKEDEISKEELLEELKDAERYLQECTQILDEDLLSGTEAEMGRMCRTEHLAIQERFKELEEVN